MMPEINISNSRHRCFKVEQQQKSWEDMAQGCVNHIHTNNLCIQLFQVPESPGEVFRVAFADKTSNYVDGFIYSLIADEGQQLTLPQHVVKIMSLIYSILGRACLEEKKELKLCGAICND